MISLKQQMNHVKGLKWNTLWRDGTWSFGKGQRKPYQDIEKEAGLNYTLEHQCGTCGHVLPNWKCKDCAGLDAVGTLPIQEQNKAENVQTGQTRESPSLSNELHPMVISVLGRNMYIGWEEDEGMHHVLVPIDKLKEALNGH